jgi:hypothetical protein
MSEQEGALTVVEGQLVEDGEVISVDNLYGDDQQVGALAERVRMVAPWVKYKSNGQWREMSKKEVSLVIRRCMALGVDPLNPHEVQIWRDHHGVHFQLAYTLLTQWMRDVQGGHTEPRYYRLSKEEKEREGISPNDKAVHCEFVMLSDMEHIAQMMDLGFDPQDARDSFTVKGLGVVDAAEWSGKYFAPNGRSKAWKLRKRAYVDAVRKRFGTPSRSEIVKLRRERGEKKLLPEDYQGTDNLMAQDRHLLALEHAKHREEEQDGRDTAILAGSDARRDQLFKGEGDNGNGSGNKPEADPEPQAESEPEQATTNDNGSNNNGRPYDPPKLQEIIGKSIEDKRGKGFTLGPKLSNYRGAMNASLELCFAGDKHSDQKRHLVLEYLTGKASSKEMDDAEVKTVHKWLNAKPDDDTGEWFPDPTAEIEAQAVAKVAAKNAGQTEFPI